MPTFITPAGYSGTSALTPANGLDIVSLGKWKFNKENLSTQDNFELSLSYPSPDAPSDFYYGPPDRSPTPQSGGELHLRAQGWPITEIGNSLTSYTDPDSGITYGPDRCRIIVNGRWQVPRRQNSDSYNSFGVKYNATTITNQGEVEMDPQLFGYTTGYEEFVIQGANVAGGAIDTFSTQVFYCKLTETATSNNSNHLFQSNTITTPFYYYSYAKSWQTSP